LKLSQFIAFHWTDVKTEFPANILGSAVCNVSGIVIFVNVVSLNAFIFIFVIPSGILFLPALVFMLINSESPLKQSYGIVVILTLLLFKTKLTVEIYVQFLNEPIPISFTELGIIILSRLYIP